MGQLCEGEEEERVERKTGMLKKWKNEKTRREVNMRRSKIENSRKKS